MASEVVAGHLAALPLIVVKSGAWPEAAIILLREVQYLQYSLVRHTCHLKSSVPITIVFQKPSVTCSMISGGEGSSSSRMQWLKVVQQQSATFPQDDIAFAQNGCSFSWAARVFRCFAEHGKHSLLMLGAPAEVQTDELHCKGQQRYVHSFTWTRARLRVQGYSDTVCVLQIRSAGHLEVPVGKNIAKLQRSLTFCMGLSYTAS